MALGGGGPGGLPQGREQEGVGWCFLEHLLEGRGPGPKSRREAPQGGPCRLRAVGLGLLLMTGCDEDCQGQCGRQVCLSGRAVPGLAGGGARPCSPGQQPLPRDRRV